MEGFEVLEWFIIDITSFDTISSGWSNMSGMFSSSDSNITNQELRRKEVLEVVEKVVEVELSSVKLWSHLIWLTTCVTRRSEWRWWCRELTIFSCFPPSSGPRTYRPVSLHILCSISDKEGKEEVEEVKTRMVFATGVWKSRQRNRRPPWSGRYVAGFCLQPDRDDWDQLTSDANKYLKWAKIKPSNLSDQYQCQIQRGGGHRYFFSWFA